jgi:hypothetical protein
MQLCLALATSFLAACSMADKSSPTSPLAPNRPALGIYDPEAGFVSVGVFGGPAGTYSFHTDVIGGGSYGGGIDLSDTFATPRTPDNALLHYAFFPVDHSTWGSGVTAQLTISEVNMPADRVVDAIQVIKNNVWLPIIYGASSVTLTTDWDDVTIIQFYHSGTPPQVCQDQNATNYGGPLPCVYPPPQICQDQNATNYGGPLPCVYPGKTFTIGPSSMEGAIKISAGDWVNGGYSFKFKSAHIATTFTVTANVTITGQCLSSGGTKLGFTDAIIVSLGTRAYSIPASSSATDWLPTGDANSVLSWQGSMVAPASLCGGGGNKLDASKGAVYTATVSQNPPTGSLVDFRFKYRDPAAKGKPNTNCLDTSDPNRAKADVCGASWSQTVTDP